MILLGGETPAIGVDWLRVFAEEDANLFAVHVAEEPLTGKATDALRAIAPVSYTHLDVYKRQV